MKKCFVAVLLVTSVAAMPTHARSAKNSGDCVVNQNATVSANFDGISETTQKVREMIDAQTEKVKAHADEIGLKDLVPTSQNYTIYTQMSNGKISNYSYNGGISFRLDDASKATDLMERMTKDGMQASVNVNINRNGNCN